MRKGKDSQASSLHQGLLVNDWMYLPTADDIAQPHLLGDTDNDSKPRASPSVTPTSNSVAWTTLANQQKAKKRRRPSQKTKYTSQLCLTKYSKKRLTLSPAHKTSIKKEDNLLDISQQVSKESKTSKHPRLNNFYKEHLSIEPDAVITNNKGMCTHSVSSHETLFAQSSISYHNFSSPVVIYDEIGPKPQWQLHLPTKLMLYKQEFGKPDSSHSFTQEACGETILHFVLKSGYLTEEEKAIVHTCHPLVSHLDIMRAQLSNYDFTWIRSIDTSYATQKRISKEKSRAMMACLFYYNLDVSLVMRYLGNNYTASHRDVGKVVSILEKHGIDSVLIQHYVRVMTVGCPNEMVAESTRANAMKYFRGGNNPSVAKKLDQVMVTMNKEERNNFVIPLPMWLWRFLPHIFCTPQHILEKEGKKDRQIFDAKYQHDPESISVNMMTSPPEETELHCEFGDVLLRLLTRIWNLRITYPDKDIVIHANDVKSCFRQIKHHPDVMGAFSYILGEFLFLQCGLAFGALFSPASWEVLRRIAEFLAESLFNDDTLRTKHRKYLDRLKWKKDLGNNKATFSPAVQDSLNQGVLRDGEPVETPHDFYVDDDLYAELFDIIRIERAVAASIEAIFILLGESALHLRQDPISFDKMEETMVSFRNRPLGKVVNTRSMLVATPRDYVMGTVLILQSRWHRKRQTYFICEIETLTGRLGHIAETVPWLRFLLAHVYSSVANALCIAQGHLISTRKEFRELLKQIKKDSAAVRFEASTPNLLNGTNNNKQPASAASRSPTVRRLTFNLSQAAKKVHKSRLPIHFNKTLRHELSMITRVLSSDNIDLHRPIAHMVHRDPSAIGYSDSCLRAAGGFSIKMKFWWYIEWPECIQKRTLRYIKNNKNNMLISINLLEYAALLIEYVAATHYYRNGGTDDSDPYPTVLLYADNTTAEAWAKMKSCKTSMAGRALGRLQCALMINNHVGINIGHVTTKDNVIADRISRIKKETNTLPDFEKLTQDFPQLTSCRRFHPSAELVSAITAILLQEKSFDPLEARDSILEKLGQNTI